MTTTTAERTRAPVAARTGYGVVQALALNEGLRLLRHPALIAGALASCFFLGSAVFSFGEPSDGEHSATYVFLTGFALLPLAIGTLVAANLTALQPRRSGAREMMKPLAATQAVRAYSSLLAVVPAMVVAAAVVGVAVLALEVRGGMRVVTPAGIVGVAPNLLELLQGPIAVALFGALGVALARVAPHPAVATLLIPLYPFQLMEVGWMGQSKRVPFLPVMHSLRSESWVETSPTSGYPIIDRIVTAAAGWHLVYLLGVIALVVVAVLARRITRVRLVTLASAGAAAVAIGGAMQLRGWGP